VLLEHKAPIGAHDEYGQTPLIRAARNGSRKMAELLIQNGANPGEKYRT